MSRETLQQSVARNTNWINSVISKSKLASQLTELVSINSSSKKISIQEGEQDAQFVTVKTLRGFKGSWNASTNSPILSNSIGFVGDIYKVSAAGSFNLGAGIKNYVIGDLIYFSENKWIKISPNQISDIDGLQIALDSLADGLIPQGNWNATSNSPNIEPNAKTGQFWIVTVAGSTSLGGITDWEVNDWAVKTASGWAKIDNSDKVLSVAGRTGVVSLNISDISNLSNSLGNKVDKVTGRELIATTDIVKLGSIETNADVTDSINVRASGALMDDEILNLAQVKTFKSSDYYSSSNPNGFTGNQDLSGLAPKASPSFTGEANFAGKLLMPNVSGVKGSSSGTGNQSYFSFYESNGTTRQGYIGVGSANESGVQLQNDVSGRTLNLKENGVLAYNGNVDFTGTGNFSGGITANGSGTFNGSGSFNGDISGSRLRINGGSVQSEILLGTSQNTDKIGLVKYFQGNGSGTGRIILSHWGDNDIGGAGLNVFKGGNVAIGLSSTSYKLDVNGTFRVASNSMFNGDVRLSKNASDSGELYFINNTYQAGIKYEGNKSLNFIDRTNTAARISFNLGNGFASFDGLVKANSYEANESNQRVKYAVWQGSTYGIGMGSAYTFGPLNNEFAMTFQMDATSGRGWWWGKNNQGNSNGCMALNNQGDLTIARHMRINYGQGDTYNTSIYPLDINGSCRVTGNSYASDFIQQSDVRLKRNITDLEPKRLKPKRYIWKDSGRLDIGFVADDLIVDFPEIVFVGEDDNIKRVSYPKITAINSASINKLYDENIELKKQYKTAIKDLNLIKKHLGI